jgi:hypothetical protein
VIFAGPATIFRRHHVAASGASRSRILPKEFNANP